MNDSEPKVIWCLEGINLTPVWGRNDSSMDIVECLLHPDFRCPDDYWHVRGFEDREEAVRALHTRVTERLKQAANDYEHVLRTYPLPD